ncbi:MAG: dynamin family protein [Terracidiphilus sp.]|jgi:ribosome biogenesis GTPase A
MTDSSGSPLPDRKGLLRAIGALSALAQRNRTEDLYASLASLSEKLQKNRFNLAVLGQMKRGKSSVINAMLGAEILPTGILPLTSVITRVRYGTTPGAQIIYKSGQCEPIGVGTLHEYITEAGNPGNRKQVASAEVTYPSQFLRMGVDLIDTPGIGSTHLHNTSTTEDYLTEVDAGIVVLSVDPPITAVEADFLRRIRLDVPRLLFVINKTDMATPAEVEAVLRFIESELRNHIGIKNPELFPLSARLTMKELREQASQKSSGIEQLTARLHYFASEEKEHTLLQSVALDMLRMADTLRLTALVGERARSMSGEALATRKRALEAALSGADQELNDLRHLLRQDTATIIARIESDLNDHAASAAPHIRSRLKAFRNEHSTETREQLGALLDQFMLNEVEAVFEDWRAQEDERVHLELAELSGRFVERTNAVLERLRGAAGTLFDVPVSRVTFASVLTVESRLYYFTDHVFQHQLDRLIFVLPKFLLRNIVFRRMLTYIDMELSRNAGRIRYDYLLRLEKSVATFEKEIKAAVAIVADNLRLVLSPRAESAEPARQVVAILDTIIAQCSGLIAQGNHC